MVEILPDNQVKPYQDEAMNSWKEGEHGKNKWVFVQAAYVDEENYLWVVGRACPNGLLFVAYLMPF